MTPSFVLPHQNMSMNLQTHSRYSLSKALTSVFLCLCMKAAATDFIVSGIPSDIWPRPDASIGVAGYTIEDFEDTNLVAGLRIGWESAAGTNAPSTHLPQVFEPTQDPNGPASGYVFTNGVWDGLHCLVNGKGNVSHPFNSPELWGNMVLEFDPPARAVGFSLEQSENPIQLTVNGTPLGNLHTLGGLNIGGGRNGYLTLRATGTIPISRIVLDNGGGDGWVIDHLAFTTDAPPTGPANLYVLGRNTGSIYGYHVTTNSAEFVSESHDPRLSSPFGLVFSGAGEMFIGNLGTHPYVFEERPGYITRYAWPYDLEHFNGDEGVGALVTPHFLAMRGEELLVADSGNDRVMRYRFGARGEAIGLPPMTHPGFMNDAVRGVVAKPDGSEILVSQCYCGGVNNVRRFRVEANGSLTDLGLLPGSFNNPHGMAFSPWGELFTANEDFVSGPTSTNWFITRHIFETNGTVRFNGAFSDSHLKFPHTLTFSPWGELFVTGTFATNVTRFTFNTDRGAVFHGTFTLPDDGAGLAFRPSEDCPAIANPTITVATKATNVVLRFPETAANFVLDWTTSLLPPVIWHPSYAARVQVDTNLEVTLPPVGGNYHAEFFRLRCPGN